MWGDENMKWLALNEIVRAGYYGNKDTEKIVINPAWIVTIKPCDSGTKIFINEESIIVEETFEEVMQILGGDCAWKMP